MVNQGFSQNFMKLSDFVVTHQKQISCMFNDMHQYPKACTIFVTDYYGVSSQTCLCSYL